MFLVSPKELGSSSRVVGTSFLKAYIIEKKTLPMPIIIISIIKAASQRL